MARCITPTAGFLAVVVCWSVPVGSFAADGAKPAKKPAKEVERIDRLKPNEAVDALINRNAAPRLNPIADGKIRPEFSAGYDWAESDRIRSLLREMGPHVEGLWPALVKHLGDERYCITVEWESGISYNWTVGDVCQRLITVPLNNGYLDSLQPLTKAQYFRFAKPAFANDQKTLKAWCEARKDKELYELQMEVCRWAAAEINDATKPAMASEAQKKDWLKRIEKNIETLSKQKKATPTTSILGDSWRFFSKRRAEQENLFAPGK
jgi:hypothetical protein